MYSTQKRVSSLSRQRKINASRGLLIFKVRKVTAREEFDPFEDRSVSGTLKGEEEENNVTG